MVATLAQHVQMNGWLMPRKMDAKHQLNVDVLKGSLTKAAPRSGLVRSAHVVLTLEIMESHVNHSQLVMVLVNIQELFPTAMSVNVAQLDG